MGLLSKCRELVTRYEAFEQIATDGYAFVYVGDNKQQRINMRLYEIDNGLEVSNCNWLYIGNASDLSAVSVVTLEDSKGRRITLPFKKDFSGCDADTKINLGVGDLKLQAVLSI